MTTADAPAAMLIDRSPHPLCPALEAAFKAPIVLLNGLSLRRLVR